MDCVPKLFFYGELLTRIFLVETYIPGKVYQSFALMPTDARDKCRDCVKTLHSKGILHGDLRAPNFIIAPDRVYIIDFGISQILNMKDKHSETLLNEEMMLFNQEIDRWKTPQKIKSGDNKPILDFDMVSKDVQG